MRVVIDTNVLLSAVILPRSVRRRAVEWVWANGRALYSATTIAEATRVLSKPRFDKYLTLAERLDILVQLEANGDEVEIATAVEECRDPHDDMVLAVAVNGGADGIVSGDLDLLALHPFRGIPILTPADFLARVMPPAGGIGEVPA